jgi:hypothetical protein
MKRFALAAIGLLALVAIRPSEIAHKILSGAAHHLGEKLAELPFQGKGSAQLQDLNIGQEFRFNSPGCDFHMARVATGTVLELRGCESSPLKN